MTNEQIALEYGLFEDHGVNGKAVDVSVLAALAAARADEREKVVDECLDICDAHSMTYGISSVARHDILALKQPLDGTNMEQNPISRGNSLDG